MRRAARYLAISSKKSLCALKKKLSRGANSSTSRPARRGRLDVGEPVGQREGELLGRRGSRLADVVARDRDRMPARQLGRAEAHHVGHQAHRGARWEDVLLLGLVLLQDVVLQRARERRTIDAGLVGHAHVHGQDGRGGRVDRHGGRDLPEVDAREERLHVGQRVDGHPGPAHLALGQWIVGITPEQRGHVEGRGEAVAAGPEQLLEAPVGVLGRAEAGELAHRPESRSGTSTRRGPACRGSNRAALPPPARTRARAAPPTWSRIAPAASVNGRTPPARFAGRTFVPDYFDVKVICNRLREIPRSLPELRQQAKQPAHLLVRHADVGEDLLVDGPGRLQRDRRPDGVKAARVTRPSSGFDRRVTRPSASSRSTALVTLAGLTCRRSPILPSGSASRLENESNIRNLVAGERESERPQDGIGPGQEDLLEPHDGRHHRHRTRLVGPPVSLPLPFRLGDGIEAQPSGFGHSGTLDRGDR